MAFLVYEDIWIRMYILNQAILCIWEICLMHEILNNIALRNNEMITSYFFSYLIYTPYKV